MSRKRANKEERKYFQLLVEYGCIACRNMFGVYSIPEIHHVRTGQGMAQRASHKDVLPLCPPHHRPSYDTGFHAAPKTWQEIHGTESELLEQTKREVMELRACRI
ncbi:MULTISPECIES: Ref family recombination enhancement nuclease [unclassified Providencia]|uniref:Ref family recombination enhancement nuclease n=1 Tax=unclassified Providencia TaxID=2633465 RepID=UPI00234BCF4B|nr:MULTISPECIES: Ref family recombination enhancement nuclease [unclassified Providencia]